MSSPQYGYQPYSEAAEGIAITTQYSKIFSTWFSACRPKILLNGDQTPVWGWGRTVLPLAPGRYDVHVHVPYIFPKQAGRADYEVAVDPGQLVELEYRAPFFTFSRGSLGPPPQRYNGILPIVAMMTVLLLFLVFAILIGG
jgi:hypothetical protein